MTMKVAADRFERYQQRTELKRARNFEKAKAKVAELLAALARVAAAVEKTRLDAAAKDAALAERLEVSGVAWGLPWSLSSQPRAEDNRGGSCRKASNTRGLAIELAPHLPLGSLI